jgi:hypothetical protein
VDRSKGSNPLEPNLIVRVVEINQKATGLLYRLPIAITHFVLSDSRVIGLRAIKNPRYDKGLLRSQRL